MGRFKVRIDGATTPDAEIEIVAHELRLEEHWARFVDAGGRAVAGVPINRVVHIVETGAQSPIAP